MPAPYQQRGGLSSAMSAAGRTARGQALRCPAREPRHLWFPGTAGSDPPRPERVSVTAPGTGFLPAGDLCVGAAGTCGKADGVSLLARGILSGAVVERPRFCLRSRRPAALQGSGLFLVCSWSVPCEARLAISKGGIREGANLPGSGGSFCAGHGASGPLGPAIRDELALSQALALA